MNVYTKQESFSLLKYTTEYILCTPEYRWQKIGDKEGYVAYYMGNRICPYHITIDSNLNDVLLPMCGHDYVIHACFYKRLNIFDFNKLKLAEHA